MIGSRTKIPEDITAKWQSIVDTLAEIMEVPDVLITKVNYPYLEAFKSSHNKENIFQEGDKVKLAGHYCEKVINTKSELLIPNAIEDKKWNRAPELKHGLVSYLGFPLEWPDGTIFGTLCVHDKKENPYTPKEKHLMKQFKELIESHLKIIDQNYNLSVQIKNKEDTENTLKKTSEKYKSIYNNIEQGICLHEIIYKDDKAVDYRIIEANPAFENILGIPLNSAIDSLASQLYGTGTAPYLEIYAKVAKTQKSINFDHYFPPMDKFFHITVTSPEKGKFITLFNDISWRKKMEREIQSNSEHLRATLKSIGDGVIATDNEGRITLMNSVAEKLTGYITKEAKGEMLTDIFKIVNANTRETVDNPVNKVLSTGNIIGLANHTVLISKDGTEYQIADSAAPIKSEDGKIEGTVLVFRDVTEKYLWEKSLKESEEKYRNLVDTAPIGIFKTTSKGEPLKINQEMANILGFHSIEETLEHYRKLSVNLYLDPNRRHEFIKEIKQNQEISNFEYQAVKKDGSRVWITMNAKIDEWKNDGSFVINGFAFDITERKIAEKNLIDKEKEVSAIYQNAPIIMMLIDENQQVHKTNEYATEFTGKSTNFLLGKKGGEALRCIHSLDNPQRCGFGPNCDQCLIRQTVLDTFATGKRHRNVEVAFSFVDQDNSAIDKTLLLFTAPLKTKNESFVLVSILDITDRKRNEDEIRYMSYHDSLTGLYNRLFFDEEIKRLDVERQLPISLIMADLNGLKLINDTYGHNKGDKVLIKTAEILKNACRKEDIIARWGGDEFVILLPQTTINEAEMILKRIRNNQAEIEISNDEKIPISISIGLAEKSNPTINIYSLFQIAEDNLYKDKLLENQSVKSHLVKTLLKTLQEKSQETEEHARRMNKLAYKIGERIGLSHSELDRLSLLATLHDIGKTIISEKILNKPGKLTKEEWAEILKHPSTGYRICSASEEFSHIALDLLAHHERWDGKGYPRGLYGKDIPLLARIIAIVDAFDVMTNGRPYNEPISINEALAELKRCAGYQFDPELAEVFVNQLDF